MTHWVIHCRTRVAFDMLVWCLQTQNVGWQPLLPGSNT